MRVALLLAVAVTLFLLRRRLARLATRATGTWVGTSRPERPVG